MTPRRTWAAGVALAVLYLGALVLTVAVHPDHLRPLYDGFVPPSAYRWVDPPAFFASGNVKPKPTSGSIALGPNGSVAAGFSTPDGQFAIDLGAGAIPPHAGAHYIDVHITPVAPRDLGPMPDGLRGDGNAYRVELTYEPGGASIGSLTTAGSMLIELPELGLRLYRSPDGAKWTPTPTHAVGARKLTLAGQFTGSGYYLGATNVSEIVTSTAKSSHSAIVAASIAVIVAIALLALVRLITRRRAGTRA